MNQAHGYLFILSSGPDEGYPLNMKFLYMIIASAMGLTLTAEAQTTSKRTCRIVFPDRPKDAPRKAYLFDGTKSYQLQLPSMNFSSIIELPEGDLTLSITPKIIRDAKALPPEAPRLKVPKTVRDFYILVSPDPENAVIPLKMEIVSLSDGKLKAGETLWINYTDHQVEAKLGENKILIAAKEQKISKSPLPASGYYKAEFTYQRDGKGEFKKITEQSWWHDVKSRHVGFIFDQGDRLPKIFFLRDFRLKPASDKTQ
jgi:hypothetical protein